MRTNVINTPGMPITPPVPHNHQGAPHVALQIEPDAPQPPLQQAQANPNRAPSWLHRLRQGLLRQTCPLITATMASAATVGTYYKRQAIGAHDASNDLGFVALATVTTSLWVMTLAIAQMVNERNPRPRDLASVANDLRNQRASSSSANAPASAQPASSSSANAPASAQHASSSSASEPAFDWLKPGLFVNENGVDVGNDVAIYLGRLKHLLDTEPGQNVSANYNQLNVYLDLLQTDEDARSALAKNVQELNKACFNRNAVSINTILLSLTKIYRDDAPIKEFMTQALFNLTIAEANAQLDLVMKSKGKKAVPEGYQAVQGDALKKVREQFPALPHQFEEVYQDFARYSLLTDTERKTICRNVVHKITTPMEFAKILQASEMENDWMEKRFAGEVSHFKAPLTNKNRYAELAQRMGKDEADLSLTEMGALDEGLKGEANKAIQTFYAGIIQAS